MLHKIKTLNIADVQLNIPKGVWAPIATGELIASKVMPTLTAHIRDHLIMDIGTGSGLFAIKGGLLGARKVVATDLNQFAVIATRENWIQNGLQEDKLDAIVSDGFEQIPKEYVGNIDLIIANPPVQPTLLTGDDPLRDKNAYAWNEAINNGRGVLDEILLKGPQYLTPQGKIVTATSSRHGYNATRKILSDLKAAKKISSWKILYEQEQPLADHYMPYVFIWEKLQEADKDVRIWKKNGVWYHRFLILQIEK